MTQRLDQYHCGACGGWVIVMRGGAGHPACCGQAMKQTVESPPDATARVAAFARNQTAMSKLPVRHCARCRVAVVVLRPGAGSLTCCAQPMREFTDDSDTAAEAEQSAVPLMEYNLNMPVGLVLHCIQRRLSHTTYFGIGAEKNPMDFWVYQEIIFELQPHVVIEIGNHYGGSLLAYAHWLDHIGRGRLIGVDIDHRVLAPAARNHPRVTLITGDACDRFGDVRDLIQDGETVLIVEDSAHTYDNTLNVLNAYCGLVTPGSYFIVEDSNCHHGIDIGPQPGAYEAIVEFLDQHPEFESDRARESFFITWNPMGYLRRRRSGTT